MYSGGRGEAASEGNSGRRLEITSSSSGAIIRASTVPQVCSIPLRSFLPRSLISPAALRPHPPASTRKHPGFPFFSSTTPRENESSPLYDTGSGAAARLMIRSLLQHLPEQRGLRLVQRGGQTWPNSETPSRHCGSGRTDTSVPAGNSAGLVLLKVGAPRVLQRRDSQKPTLRPQGSRERTFAAWMPSNV